MKEELVNKIISAVQLLGALGLTVFGLLAGWKVWVKEKSVGAQKIIELMEADKKMMQDIQELKDENKEQTGLIEKLEKHYNDIVNQLLSFLKK